MKGGLAFRASREVLGPCRSGILLEGILMPDAVRVPRVGVGAFPKGLVVGQLLFCGEAVPRRLNAWLVLILAVAIDSVQNSASAVAFPLEPALDSSRAIVTVDTGNNVPKGLFFF